MIPTPLNANLILQSSSILRLQLQQSPLLQILRDLPYCILHASLVALDLDLRVLRCLIRGANTSELWNLTLPSFLVQALGVTGFGYFEREIYENLDKGKRLVIRVGSDWCGVQLASDGAIGFVGRDEGSDGNGGAVGEELGDLLAGCVSFSASLSQWSLVIAVHCVLAPPSSAIVILRTSAIRRIFSFLSFSEKPRSLLSPNRTLSPSRRYDARPRWRRCCSRAVAMVDLPEAERPVNQIVKPRCLRYMLRSLRERDGCQVMLLLGCYEHFCERPRGMVGSYVAIALCFALRVKGCNWVMKECLKVLRSEENWIKYSF